MKLFNNFRNTTGHGATVNVAGATHSRTEVRPHSNQILRSGGIPQTKDLRARVDDFPQSGLRVAAAKEFVAQCETTVQHHPGPLVARTEGRAKHFFKSAVNTMGKAVGIARGSAPHVEPDWVRPDQSMPVKIDVGPSKLHRALFGVTAAQKQAARDLTATVALKANQLTAESKVALRGATDRETALLNKTAHVDGVQQTLRTALQLAREEHAEKLAIFDGFRSLHEESVTQLTVTGERLTALQTERATLRGQARGLSHEIGANRAQREALEARLLQLPDAPPADALVAAVAAQARANRGLERAQAGLPPRRQALEAAQQNLDDTKLRLRHALPFSRDRAVIKTQVNACRLIRNEARVALAAHQNIVNRFQTQLQRRTQVVNALEAQTNGNAERLLVADELDVLAQAAVQLGERGRQMRTDLAQSDATLAAAQTDHDDAKDAEVAARIEMERADRAQQATRVRRDGLERELPKLEPVAQSLVGPTQEAHARASVLRQEQAMRLTQKVNALVTSPPGFDRSQVTPELQEQMRLLVERLDGVPAGSNPQQVQNLRRDRMPIDQSLEIISRSLALATRGQGADATLALTDLMNRQYADLVPQRGTNFNGQDQRTGSVLNDDSDVKRTAILLSNRPGGAELLGRLVQPSPEPPSRQLQDAVAVYFRATQLTSPAITKDTDSLDWLHYAEEAAKRLAHPGPGVDDETAMHDLNRLQRVAFNGVRNGFTSLAEGSPYDKANKAVQKFSDQWVPRARNNESKTSPLHARHLLTKVAADVGFPSLENQLNEQLKKACDELQKLVANQLVDARGRVALARQQQAANPAGADGAAAGAAPALPEVPAALIEAQHVLHYIRKRADRGDRIDTMNLDSKAWKSITKKTNRDVKHEMLAQSAPLAGRTGPFSQQLRTLDEVNQQLSANRPEPGGRIPDPAELGDQPAFSALEWALLGMKADKPKVLEALRQLQMHVDPAHPAATDAHAAAALSADELADLDAALNALDDDPEADGLGEAEQNSAAGSADHDDPLLQDLQRRLNVLRGIEPDAHEVQDNLDEALDDLDDDDFHTAYGGSESDGESISSSGSSSDDNPELQDLQRRLNVLDGGDFFRQQARPDWVNPPGGVVPPIPEISEADTDPLSPADQALLDELDALPDPPAVPDRPISDLQRALNEADSLTQRIDRFRNSTGDFSPEALEQWMIPAIADNFGVIAANQGRHVGLGTGGLAGAVADITGCMGLVVRPELDGNVSKNSQFKYGRDYYGIELSVGRNKGYSIGAGVSAGLLNSVSGTNDILAVGPGASLTHTWTQTNTNEGAVIRAPKSPDNTHQQLTRDLSEMVSTALTWREELGADQSPLYKNPLEALLDRHPTISVSAVESAKAASHSANARLTAFALPSGAVGNSNLAAMVTAVGVSSTSTQDRTKFKASAGVQGFVSQTDAVTRTVGVGAGASAGVRITDHGVENLAPVRISLASVAANAAVRKSSALGGANIIRMSDGTIAAERFVEFSSYEKFEAAVRPHREKWIQAGISTGRWPDGFPESDKRIVVERALDDYMATSKASLKSGTVTLNETMSVKPEVCTQLSANLALEELARIEGRHEDALALQVTRERILADDSSYQPLFLKTLGRSSIAEGKGWNLLVSAMSSKSAAVTRAIDWFPRVAS